MSIAKALIEPIAGSQHVVRIPLGALSDNQTAVEILKESFRSCFENGQYRIILDLKSINFPSSSLIALLIEATNRVRRLNGDLKIINLSNSAKNNFATFSPLSFLSFEKDESYALQDFQSDSSQPEMLKIDSDEIAEDPILEKLQDSVEHFPVSDEQVHHLRVESDSKNLYTICDFVTDFANKAGFNPKDVGKIKIAVYEASLNVIEHAYHSKPDEWIDIWVDYNELTFKVVLQDYGTRFEGINIKDYNVVSAMDHRQTGGFGLYIIRRSMDEIDYESDNVNGNRLTLIKYLK
ncbi:MAG: ATP-binding protein [bacterium]